MARERERQFSPLLLILQSKDDENSSVETTYRVELYVFLVSVLVVIVKQCLIGHFLRSPTAALSKM